MTSETHKVGVVTQKEYIDGGMSLVIMLVCLLSYMLADGTVKRQTIPPEKWDADLASTSEEIIKAERKHPGKDISMENLQKKSLKGLEEKEQKMAHAKKNPNNDE